MIKSRNKGKNRISVIIEFNDFENIFIDTTSTNYRWIRRVEDVFSDLDMEKSIAYDARITQLKKTYEANVQLLETFISLTDLTRDAKVNERFYRLKSN